MIAFMDELRSCQNDGLYAPVFGEYSNFPRVLVSAPWTFSFSAWTGRIPSCWPASLSLPDRRKKSTLLAERDSLGRLGEPCDEKLRLPRHRSAGTTPPVARSPVRGAVAASDPVSPS